MKHATLLLMLLACSISWAQSSVSESELPGYYSSNIGSLVLNADGTARIPSDLRDPSADGARWSADGSTMWITPFAYSGPREFNNTMDLIPMLFSAEKKQGKIVLTYSSRFGEYTFSK
jgi:hypothetical protein